MEFIDLNQCPIENDYFNERDDNQFFLDEWEGQEAIDTSITKAVQKGFSQPNTNDSLSLIQSNYLSDNDEDNNQSVAADSTRNFMEGPCEDTTAIFSTDLIFTDRDSLITWCREVGLNVGFVVVIKNSNSAKNGRKPRVYLACERSGEYRPRAKKENVAITGENCSTKVTYKSGTTKCSCPFKLKGVLCGEDKWKLIVDCGFHNHYFGDNLIGHSYVAKFTEEQQELVKDLTFGGAVPREIQSIMKERFPENLSTRKTIYNFRARHKLKTHEGRSQMQHLFKNLNDHGYVEFHRENTATGECLDIFLAHPESILLAKCFPEVIVMDCTYKTNKHKLPLLEIVGFTSTMKTFLIAYVYLESEKEENYLWALQKLHQVLESKVSDVGVIVTDCEMALMNAIPKVFPSVKHLLCRWHITTNIEAKYKNTFKTNEEWDDFIGDIKDLMESARLIDYNNKLQKLRREYGNHHGIMDYFEKQWLAKYKDRFVSVWTNSVMHFGTLTTNRAESMHASLKRYLGSSIGNLTRNWGMIDNLLANQLTEIENTFNKSRNRWLLCYREKEYAQVRGLISSAALDMLAKELKRSKIVGVSKEQCRCVVKNTCGIPCAHELTELVLLESSIPFTSIHQRWRKLDSTPAEISRGALDITPHLEKIKKKFMEEPDYQKVMMLKKCDEIGDPKGTFLQEPKLKINVRGRPRKSKKSVASSKSDFDTKRDLSAFEYAQTQEEKNADEQKKKRPRKVNNTNIFKMLDVECEPKWADGLNELNPLIQDFIESWEDVPGDGHCGYRSIAKLLGYNDHDGWINVRSLLLKELMAHCHEYMEMFGTEGIPFLKSNLECRDVETYNKDNWFTVLDMDEVLMVAVGHINERKHFVPLLLEENAPLPPINGQWERYKWPHAAPWRILLQSKLNEWDMKTLPRNIMLRDDAFLTKNQVINLEDNHEEAMVRRKYQKLVLPASQSKSISTDCARNQAIKGQIQGPTPPQRQASTQRLLTADCSRNQTIKEQIGPTPPGREASTQGLLIPDCSKDENIKEQEMISMGRVSIYGQHFSQGSTSQLSYNQNKKKNLYDIFQD